MSLLTLADVVAGYGGHTVLDRVGLVVRPGEIVGLIGPNGSGKSTLIRVASGVLPARSGRVLLGDVPVGDLTPAVRARRVAVVGQAPLIPGAFSAWETVMLGRTPHLGLLRGESAADRAAVRAAMERAGCWQWRDRRMGQLSGGERQRVLVARVLAQGAPLLLLDEPTTHLDIRAQVETLDLVRALAREGGRGVLAALHDLTLAAQFADRLILLAGGRIRREGVPADVLTEAAIAEAYGAATLVLPHPHTARPVVVPALLEGLGDGG